MTPEDVRRFLSSYLESKLRSRGLDTQALPDNCDLLLEGLIDSFDLLQLMTALSQHYGHPIDFEGLAPDDMTVVGPLCRYISAQLRGPFISPA
ncbi:MAG TPA: hypothetical protein VG322_10305 [Candidatus Acidoferrales bacterium]|jgi:acyl carrier protein|nr:hypothetical protein [Candidatus Acidoferrales bacterium]